MPTGYGKCGGSPRAVQPTGSVNAARNRSRAQLVIARRQGLKPDRAAVADRRERLRDRRVVDLAGAGLAAARARRRPGSRRCRVLPAAAARSGSPRRSARGRGRASAAGCGWSTASTSARQSAARPNGTPGWSTSALRFSRTNITPWRSPSSATRASVARAFSHMAPVTTCDRLHRQTLAVEPGAVEVEARDAEPLGDRDRLLGGPEQLVRPVRDRSGRR